VTGLDRDQAPQDTISVGESDASFGSAC